MSEQEKEQEDFNRGVIDCQNGVSCRENNYAYHNGYGSEYAKEQQQSAGETN
jgi:hypothetical protein